MKTNRQHAWVDVATFGRPNDAKAVQALLQREGLETQVHDERKLQSLWFLASHHAGVHVQVPKEDFERAKQCLDAVPGARMIRCPSCHSSRVQYPAMTRKNLLPTVVAQMMILLRLTKREYYCEDCHYTWVNNRSRHLAGAAAL